MNTNQTVTVVPKLHNTQKLCKCPFCDESFTWANLHKHKKEAHGYTRQYKDKPPVLSHAERLDAIQRDIDKSIRELESERDTLHRKVLELDGTISAYKKLLINNGKK